MVESIDWMIVLRFCLIWGGLIAVVAILQILTSHFLDGKK